LRAKCLALLALLGATACSDTSVYVTNNTPRPLTLEYSSTLDPAEWKTKAKTVPPFSRRKVLELKNGAARGASDFVKVQITPRDAATGAMLLPGSPPFEMRVRLRDGAVFGNLAHSHSWGAAQAKARGPGRAQEDAALEVAGREWNVSYDARSPDGSRDIEYVFREEYPLPAEFTEPMPEGWEASHFNILTYNVFMRPMIAFADGQLIRAKLIPPQLRGYDAVVFQEAFDDRARKTLLAGMAKQGYVHVTRVLGTDSGFVQDGGVVIASRHPIVDEAQQLFTSCSKSNCLAKKGVVYAKINKRIGGRDHYFHIFATHLNTVKSPATQDRQLDEIRAFIESRRIPASEAVIIAGDMNIDWHDRERFQTMLTKLDAGYFGGKWIRGHKPAGRQLTYEGSVNDITDGWSSYIDYILYSKAHRGPAEGSFVETRVPRALEPWREYPFEQPRWDLSDHYAVYGSLQFAQGPGRARRN
jgi:endonuclease/exonuclease/phosphatase family metal-dependent hydrolase